METKKNHHELVYYVQNQGKAALEGRQLTRRLQSLLPLRLNTLKEQWRCGRSAGRAERHALVDKRYLAHVSELVAITSDAREHRVQYETHKMLIQARQSLRRAGPLA